MLKARWRLTPALGLTSIARGNVVHQPQWSLPQQPLITITSKEALRMKAEKMNSTLLIDQYPGPIAVVSRLRRTPYPGRHARAKRTMGHLPSETESILFVTS